MSNSNNGSGSGRGVEGFSLGSELEAARLGLRVLKYLENRGGNDIFKKYKAGNKMQTENKMMSIIMVVCAL